MTKLALLIRGTALLLCLLIFQATSTSHGQSSVSGACISSERDALLSFKASLLDPAGRLSSWQGEDCCQWKGVRCSNRTGHLIKLNLRNIGMEGYKGYYMYIMGYSMYGRGDYIDDYNFPNRSRSLSLSAGEMSSSLATLQHLRYLDLSWNDFNGTSIPVFLASLKNLRYLNLSSARFGGRIPSQLGNLSKLQYLDVSWNYYYGNTSYIVDLAWLPRLSLLRHLDMSYVDFGSARDWFQRVNMLPSLKVLRLSDCGLNGTVSAGISISNLTHLEVLDMSTNTFRIPSQFGNLSKLQYLDVSQSFYPDVDLAWLPRLSLLRHLDMSFVYLGSARDWFQRVNMLHSLKVLRLFDCGLNGTMFASISLSNLTHLEVLDMTGNNFHTSLKHAWFWNLTGLKELHLSYSGLEGSIPSDLANMTSLQVIDFSSNDLVGVLLKEHFASLGNLKVLDLSYNNFNSVKDQFASLGKLEHLDLSHNNLSGVLLKEHFASLGNLKVLKLRYNNFNSVEEQFASLGNLEYLDLSHNNFSSVLLREHFASLGNLHHLDLSYNKFSGVLFKEDFASLGNLEYLDLSYNNFSEFLLKEHPTSLGNLKHLDLSHNKLDSVLVEEHFAGLLNLEHLDLSYNSLILAINQKWVPPFSLKVARFQSCQLGPSFPEWLKGQSDIDVLVLGDANLDDVIP